MALIIGKPLCGCTEKSVKKFSVLVETLMYSPEQWKHSQQETAIKIYNSFLNIQIQTGTLCSHKLFVYGVVAQNPSTWDLILSSKLLSVDEARFIGERELHDWAKIVDKVDIFYKPYVKEDILEYMKQQSSQYVTLAGIKTKVLSVDDIKSFGKLPPSVVGVFARMGIIKSKVLNQKEVIELISHHPYALYDYVDCYLKAYKPKGKKLEEFIIEMLYFSKGNFDRLWRAGVPYGLPAKRLRSLVESGTVQVDSKKLKSRLSDQSQEEFFIILFDRTVCSVGALNLLALLFYF